MNAGKKEEGRGASYLRSKSFEGNLERQSFWHLLPKLQATQYGFMPQRGTEDALYELMTHIYNEQNVKKIILTMLFYIEGAFGIAWWKQEETAGLDHWCPSVLPRFDPYDRKVGGAMGSGGLIFSRLLPLDIRVNETVWLYKVKRGKDLGDAFVDLELEKSVYFGKLSHPMLVSDI
ncbi:hypothetical protein EVAR_20015_1 [Eumeta japonica]|uniref:Uncharacterized protein n=1 Tax=Eumeta variegata TaxID=151549 RepID=A0A4C1VD07_EUMVA|nr:hypothetical protein EVAR_20015_1 [Eumeta japonica]